jgi:hypothetical protein
MEKVEKIGPPLLPTEVFFFSSQWPKSAILDLRSLVTSEVHPCRCSYEQNGYLMGEECRGVQWKGDITA